MLEYDYNGLRTRKGERYYYWLGNTLKMERWGENTIYYYYDESGISGFRYDDKEYYYHKNIFGDVVAIYDKNKDLQATYDYDAWGNHTVTNATDDNIGDVNPIRYRGYYYDVETQLFYCNSRYYSPELCRFISPDSIEYLDPESINGLNLYCYCYNNPIMYADPSGHAPEWLQGLAIGLAIVGAVLVVGAITALTMGVGTTIMATTMAGAVIHGAAVGTLIGAGVGVVAGGIIGGAATDWSAEGILIGMGIGFGGGAIIGAIAGGSVGAYQYASAVNSWYGGKEKMISHFMDHGKKEGYKNVIQYTKSAKNVIKNGTYITQKNAYLISKTANKFYYVGVAQNSTLITTYYTKTLTKTAMTLLGLI